MPDLTYLYAIVGAGGEAEHAMGDVRGIDDAPVTVLAAGELRAYCSPVRSTDWEEAALDANVRNMDWLAPHATRHQQVLAALHTASPSMLPLPFATLYRHPEAIRELLQVRQSELVAALRRLQGTEEWALKVFQDQGIFDEHLEGLSRPLAEARETLKHASPGKAYLMRKQLDALRKEEAARVTGLVTREIEARIVPYVHDLRREPVTASAGVTVQTERLVLKLALLLDRSQRQALHTQLAGTVAEYEVLGYRFELTGPWPPYSFTNPIGG